MEGWKGEGLERVQEGGREGGRKRERERSLFIFHDKEMKLVVELHPPTLFQLIW